MTSASFAGSRTSTAETPTEQLQKLASSPHIKFGDCTISLHVDKDASGVADVVTISLVHPRRGQEMRYEITDAAKKWSEIVVEYNTLRGAAIVAGRDANIIIASNQSFDAVAHSLEKLKGPEIGAKVRTFDFQGPPDTFNLLSPTTIDPSLNGYQSRSGAPSSEIEQLKDIRRGTRRLILDDGATQLELRMGKRYEVLISIPGGKDSTKAATFGVELDRGLSGEELTSQIKEILALLKGRDAAKLFQGTEAAPPSDPLVAKMLELGKLSHLENVHLKHFKAAKEDLSEKCTIKDVILEDSKLILNGKFLAKNLETRGRTHLMLEAAGSVLDSCTFNEGTILTGGAANLSGGLKGSVIMGNTKLHCNAANCDLRELVFRESLNGPQEEAKWENVKGLVYTRSMTAATLTRMGNSIEKKAFSNMLNELDSGFNPASLGKNIQALRPDIKVESLPDETVAGRVYSKLLLRDPEGYRSVEALIPKTIEGDRADSKNLIKLKLVLVHADFGRKVDDLTALDGYAASAATISWLAQRATLPPQLNRFGVEQISKSQEPELTPKEQRIVEAFADPFLRDARTAFREKLARAGGEIESQILRFVNGEKVEFTQPASEALEKFMADHLDAGVIEAWQNASLEPKEPATEGPSGERKSKGAGGGPKRKRK